MSNALDWLLKFRLLDYAYFYILFDFLDIVRKRKLWKNVDNNFSERIIIQVVKYFLPTIIEFTRERLKGNKILLSRFLKEI